MLATTYAVVFGVRRRVQDAWPACKLECCQPDPLSGGFIFFPGGAPRSTAELSRAWRFRGGGMTLLLPRVAAARFVKGGPWISRGSHGVHWFGAASISVCVLLCFRDE